MDIRRGNGEAVVGFQDRVSSKHMSARWRAAFLVSRGLPGSGSLRQLAANLEDNAPVVALISGSERRDLSGVVERLLQGDLITHKAVAVGPLMAVWGRRLEPEQATLFRARLEAARNRGEVWMQTVGQCMEPSIGPGDEIRVFLGDSVRTGEVALVLGPEPSAHRLLGWLGVGPVRYALHAGDRGVPGLVLETSVLGRVVEVRSGDGEVPRPLGTNPPDAGVFLKALALLASADARRWALKLLRTLPGVGALFQNDR
jgi:hypothetical protein